MDNFFRITVGSSVGSIVFDYPCGEMSLNTSFDFNVGSNLLGNTIKNQWDCGSCGVLDDMGRGMMLGVRKVKSENKTKFDLVEIKKVGDKVERKRISPSSNYPSLHYQDLTPKDVRVEWIEGGETKMIGSKSLE